MSSPTLAHTNGKMNGMNGSTPTQDSWLQQTVHQFFTAFNWEGHSPEVQELKLTALQGSDASLSLTLTVTQFFGAIAGMAARSPLRPPQPPLPHPPPKTSPWKTSLTSSKSSFPTLAIHLQSPLICHP
ncbi:MAG: hypothetical protein HC840_15130 [Leptolyngbyaceae cyanobacterium RM2_2_4]|nr:hypothetical protein [Leptolyngbyaceae cyanobacterium RM2_2_4]